MEFLQKNKEKEEFNAQKWPKVKTWHLLWINKGQSMADWNKVDDSRNS